MEPGTSRLTLAGRPRQLCRPGHRLQFVNPVLTCGSFIPANPGNLNTAEFCDPPIDTQAEKALADEVGDPATAAGQWAAIDHELVDQAPWVPLYNPRDLTVLSARTGNYQFHPYWNLLIDQLWVR